MDADTDRGLYETLEMSRKEWLMSGARREDAGTAGGLIREGCAGGLRRGCKRRSAGRGGQCSGDQGKGLSVQMCGGGRGGRFGWSRRMSRGPCEGRDGDADA